jgi:3-oxoacyl-[acyl-carrier protein] reductase
VGWVSSDNGLSQSEDGIDMNQLDLKNRIAIITGGAQGIGYAIAERMLASGARVVLWDIDPASLAAAQRRLEPSGYLSVQALDITDEEAIEQATLAVMAYHGQIDILVNNAGITGGNAATWELDPKVWRRVVEVNLIGSYLTCRAVVPHMVGRRYGRIVNVASIAGKEGNPNASHYSASKAGLIGLTKSLGKELAGTGVLVNVVTPAAVKTSLFDSMSDEHIAFMLSRIPMARFLQTDELSAMVCWLSTSECSFSTGAVFDISGGRATY